MLEQIGDVSRINEYIKRAKDKTDGFRLMGFGHRVYKNFDPRAKLMRETCHEVLNEMGLHNNRLLNSLWSWKESHLRTNILLLKTLSKC